MKPSLEINKTCIQCDNCRLICPEGSIFVFDGSYKIENWSCTLCELCIAICPPDSIKYKEEESDKKVI